MTSEQIEIDLAEVPPEVARDRRRAVPQRGHGGAAHPGPAARVRHRVLDLRLTTMSWSVRRTWRRRCRGETALVLGELYRHRAEWKFKVIGQGYDNGIAGIAADYGITL